MAGVLAGTVTAGGMIETLVAFLASAGGNRYCAPSDRVYRAVDKPDVPEKPGEGCLCGAPLVTPW